ncbi:MAG TPA: DsbA family oxidoreductase [Spirochaetia bacterium]|nr:DsbA family oxidoreductase [Spirochaetia bacterium]
MNLEIWSDVVCPWCYIGKRRLESALANFEYADAVSVTWRSFELDPQAPREDAAPLDEVLSRKYGMTIDQARAANARVSALAAVEGLEYHLDRARRANSFDAHRLIHLAAEKGLQDEMKERLMLAHFTETAAIGDPAVLIRIAAEIGLEETEARDVLQTDRFAEEVRSDEAEARSIGISGVPFFVIERKWGISGAQPVEVFSEALATAWATLRAETATG